MDPIKFKNDYGYPPASEAFFVWHGEACSQRYATRVEAENAATIIAVQHPGDDVLVLGAVSAISTSKECVGRRFNPDRALPEPVPEAPPEPAPEFSEVDAVDEPLASQEPL